jgi:hypothetical protein
LVDQFDSNTSGSYVNQKWGTAVPVVTWDGTQNAITTLGPNNPGSGSAKWVVSWTITGDQVQVTRAFNSGAVLNLTNFSSVSFDIMFAANSATDGKGSYGAVEVDAIPQSDGWPSTALAIYTSAVANGNGWIHVSLPVNAAGNAKLSAVTGIGLKIQQSQTGANLSGTTTFWIDNIIFSGYTASPVTGPPQIIQLNAAQLWQRLEFQITNVPAVSNPFDPGLIALDATFTMPSGKIMVVPAFWYQGYTRSISGGTEYDTVSGPPQWRLRFTPPEVGSYSLSLAMQTNGQPCGTIITNFVVASNSPPARFGYVGIAPGNQYFQTGDGQGLPLNGEDVAWPSSRGTYDYDGWFASMQAATENFARVWMWPTSFGIEDAPGTLNNYALQPAWQLDYVLQLAEQKGIYVQLCLDYHGMFEVTPDVWGGNNYWPTNPYNITNGGPCINQDAFFTNSPAKATYQKRLRYLIARYGYSQNLLDWEFFNEIDHEFAYINTTDLAAWHSQMGSWLHVNDPYKHLVTTSLSYASADPGLWAVPQLDFLSWHNYFNGKTNPAAAMVSDASYYRQTYGRAVQVGEYGTDWTGWGNAVVGDPYLRGLRQGIWGGALGGSVGTAMSWWWQNIDSANDYWLYSSLGAILDRTGWGRGSWTNIVFGSGQPLTAIGLRGSHESLLYVVAADAAWPTGGTNATLPVQHGQTLVLTNWPAGSFYAQWYDPTTGLLVGNSQATAIHGGLTLPLPDYSVDLAGIVYPPPTLTAPAVNPGGTFQFQLNSESGGIFAIEKSTNLVNWIAFLTVTNAQGLSTVTDSGFSANMPMFYRVEHN